MTLHSIINAHTNMAPTTSPRTASVSVVYAETRPPVLWTGKTTCGRVLICVDGSGRVKFYFFILNSYVSWSPVRRTAHSALHVMLLSYYI